MATNAILYARVEAAVLQRGPKPTVQLVEHLIVGVDVLAVSLFKLVARG